MSKEVKIRMQQGMNQTLTYLFAAMLYFSVVSRWGLLATRLATGMLSRRR